MKFWRKFRALFSRCRLEREMAEEMQAHIDELTERNVASGMSPEEARYAALRAFGGVEQVKERARDERRFLWFEQLAQDLRFATRSLCKNPSFTAVVVCSVALGIGANTAVFSLVNAVMLRLLPVRAPEELVLFNWLADEGVSPRSISAFSTRDPLTGEATSTSFSLHTFEEFRDHNTSLASVFAFAPAFGGFNVNVDGYAEIARSAQFASGQYFSGLGVTAVAGRLFTAADDQASAPPVAVISYRYWQQRFAGDPGAIGKSVLVNNVPVTIIGVTPSRFAGTLQVGDYTDITLPLGLKPQFSLNPQQDRKPDFWWLHIMGRLKPGVTLEQTQTDLAGVFQETIRGNLDLSRKTAESSKATAISVEADSEGMRLRAQSGAQGLVDTRRENQRSLQLLFGLVGLVLLIACANVANLLLARGASRRREISIRLALGASRARIVRQLLTESILLALLGAALGLVFSAWGGAALLALHPLGPATTALDISLDLRVLVFTTVVAVLAGILFGLVPALRASRVNLSTEFQGGARTLGTGSRSILARLLMTVQVALALVLLVGAGLFVRTLQNLENVDVGFNRNDLLQFQLNAVANGTPENQAFAVYDRIAVRLANVPGIKQAGYSQVQLLAGGSWTSIVYTPGGESGVTQTIIRVNAIDPNFITTIGLPVLAGRDFTDRDAAAAPKVALINQTLAEKLFGHENPVGRRVGFGSKEPNTEIIGVVRDAQYYNVKTAIPPTLYRPFAQSGNPRSAQFSVRLAAGPAVVVPALRSAIREIDPTLPIFDLRTLDDQVDRLFTQERLFASLCSVFSVLALVLAVVGLYGLMAYAVRRRTGEIGLRMALGALPSEVIWMVLRESTLLVAIGIIVGSAVALGATRWISSLLFGLSPTDPLTFGLAAIILITASFIASILPAIRAAMVDPMEALRCD